MPGQQLDDAYREAVRRAKAMSPEEKVFEGFRLFEEECARLAAQIRSEHPDYTDEEVTLGVHEHFEKERQEKERIIREFGLTP